MTKPTDKIRRAVSRLVEAEVGHAFKGHNQASPDEIALIREDLKAAKANFRRELDKLDARLRGMRVVRQLKSTT